MTGNEFTHEPPICPNCKKKMELVDIDINFYGCQDNYFECSNCEIGIIQKVRYGKILKPHLPKGILKKDIAKEIDGEEQ